ncbi:MAG: DUF262 domain-containing HNH endonuclease family protein [Rivularia sp. (in: cyanobacteria)]
MSEQEIKSQDLNIGKLFEDFYIIPKYQREYVWTEKNVEQLLNDIYAEFPSIEFSNKADDYFIGSIVVCPQEDSENNLYAVIDGQQRITTIYILSCVIKNYIHQLDNHKLTSNIEKNIKGTDTDSKGYPVERHKVKLQYDDRSKILETFADDRPDFNSIDLKQASDSIKNLINAYDTINTFIKMQLGDKEDEIRRFYVHLTRKIKLVRVTTSDINHALRVFETINDRGIGLNPMDLLKNLIFKQASSEDFKKLSESWKQAIDILEKVGEKPFAFLRHFIFSQFDVKREDVQNKEYEWILNNDSICDYSNNPVIFVGKINNYAEAYTLFLNGKNSDKTTNKFLDNIKILTPTSRQHMSLLLSAKSFSYEMFLKLCYELENFLFLVIITKQKTNEYERTFILWAQKIRNIKTEEELKTFIEDNINPIKIKYRNKFRQAFIELQESDIQKYKLKYILAKLAQYIEEQAFGVEAPQSDLNNFFKSSIEIEHILPQKPTQDVIEKFDKPDGIEKCIKKLGNLTLLEKSINSSIQNGLFISKKEAYKQSKIYLTKSIVDPIQVGNNTKIDQAVKDLKTFDDWTYKSIEDRQEIMTNLAIKLWNMDIPDII